MPAISVFLLWRGKTNYSCGFFSNVALAKFRQTFRYNTFLIGRGNKRGCRVETAFFISLEDYLFSFPA